MAGEWIKMRAALLANPRVHGIAKAIGANAEASAALTTGFSGRPDEVLSRNALRNVTVTALLVTWASANEHSSDGLMRYCDLQDIDDIAGIPGFGEAMSAVGWAVFDNQSNSVSLPNFAEWNSPAQDRTNAERQRRYRDRRVTLRNGVTVTTEKSREEKSREEEIQPAAPVASSETRKPRSRSKPADSIRWSPAAGWEGIEAADRTAWATAFPACDIAGELARMTEWLKSNPEKAHKSRWRAFVTKWLTRSQDRGGGQPSNRTAGGGLAPMSLDEKLARDRREARKKPAWRSPPAGCPEDLAGHFFNQMLSQEHFEENLRRVAQIIRQRQQEAATSQSSPLTLPQAVQQATPF